MLFQVASLQMVWKLKYLMVAHGIISAIRGVVHQAVVIIRRLRISVFTESTRWIR